MALILSIDTSLEEAAVCIAEDKHILAVKKNSRQMDHAAWIQTAIKEMFSETDRNKQYLGSRGSCRSRFVYWAEGSYGYSKRNLLRRRSSTDH